jgi:hypothetical protein
MRLVQTNILALPATEKCRSRRNHKIESKETAWHELNDFVQTVMIDLCDVYKPAGMVVHGFTRVWHGTDSRRSHGSPESPGALMAMFKW